MSLIDILKAFREAGEVQAPAEGEEDELYFYRVLERLTGLARAYLGIILTFERDGQWIFRLAAGPGVGDLPWFVLRSDVVKQARRTKGAVLRRGRDERGRRQLILCKRLQCSPVYRRRHLRLGRRLSLPIWGVLYLDSAHLPPEYRTPDPHGRETGCDEDFQRFLAANAPATCAPPASWRGGSEDAGFPVRPDHPLGLDSSHAQPEFLEELDAEGGATRPCPFSA